MAKGRGCNWIRHHICLHFSQHAQKIFIKLSASLHGYNIEKFFIVYKTYEYYSNPFSWPF